MSDPQTAFRARLVEEAQATAQIARDLEAQRARAERVIAEAETDLHRLGRLATFARAESERIAMAIVAHDAAARAAARQSEGAS